MWTLGWMDGWHEYIVKGTTCQIKQLKMVGAFISFFLGLPTTYQTTSITIILYCHGPQIWPALLPFTPCGQLYYPSARGPKSLFCFLPRAGLPLGSCVQISKLQQRPELNGKLGTVVGWDSHQDRCQVGWLVWWLEMVEMAGLDMKLMTQLYIELIFVWQNPQKCWKLDSFRGCLRLFLWA